MPLIKSKSKKAVGKNISKMESEGYPHKRAVAAALETQRRAGGGKTKPKKKRST
jgi:hypothetical protein